MVHGELSDPIPSAKERGVRENNDSPRPVLGRRRERAVKLVHIPHFDGSNGQP